MSLLTWLLGETELQKQRRRLRGLVESIAKTQLRNAIALSASRLEHLAAGGEPFHRLSPPADSPFAPGVQPSYHPVYHYETDKRSGFPFVPKVLWEQDPIFGWPFDWFSDSTDSGFGVGIPVNAFPREMYPERPTSLRTQIAQDAVRFQSRIWYETLPFYSGPIGHLRNYVCGSGITWDAVALESEEVRHEQDEGEAQTAATEVEEVQQSNPNEELAGEIQEYLDGFAAFRHNALRRRIKDACLNLFVDGESALRVLPPPRPLENEPEQYPEIITVDTSTIRGPHNEVTGPWAYGLLTSWPRRLDDVRAFHVWYPDNTHEDVSPDVLKFAKLETTRMNTKRGIPLCYKIRKQLPQMAKLLDCMAVGEAARQAIPYIRQFNVADRGAVRAATPSYIDSHDVMEDEYATALGMGRRAGEITPGQVPLINKGQEFQDTPQGRAESGSMAYRTLAETVACAFNVPLWFITGTADQENYASSLVSESPLTKTVQNAQDIVTAHCKEVCEAAVEMAVALGKFPPDWREKVEIHCELPSPIARDPDKAIDADCKLLDKKLLSPQHLCVRNGLDFDEEQELTTQAEAAGWEAQSPADLLALEQPGGDKSPQPPE